MAPSACKRTPKKGGRTAAQRQRSASKSLKGDDSPISARNLRTPTSGDVGSTSTPRSYSHRLPTKQERQSNGRVAGRSLIKWGRPKMAEKLLLHLYYECTRHKTAIPWDAIAHRFHPGSSGAAIVQHFNRLRKELIADGHLVPPVATKPGPGSASEANIRGYTRSFLEGDDITTTRPVFFDEDMPDLKFNIPNAYDCEADESMLDSPNNASSQELSQQELGSPPPLRAAYEAFEQGAMLRGPEYAAFLGAKGRGADDYDGDAATSFDSEVSTDESRTNSHPIARRLFASGSGQTPVLYYEHPPPQASSHLPPGIRNDAVFPPGPSDLARDPGMTMQRPNQNTMAAHRGYWPPPPYTQLPYHSGYGVPYPSHGMPSHIYEAEMARLYSQSQADRLQPRDGFEGNGSIPSANTRSEAVSLRLKTEVTTDNDPENTEGNDVDSFTENYHMMRVAKNETNTGMDDSF